MSSSGHQESGLKLKPIVECTSKDGNSFGPDKIRIDLSEPASFGRREYVKPRLAELMCFNLDCRYVFHLAQVLREWQTRCAMNEVLQQMRRRPLPATNSCQQFPTLSVT